MIAFPRTMVGGVSLPRLIVGSNWFLGYSHTSRAKDRFIHEQLTRDRIADVLCVFLEHGVDAVMGPLHEKLTDAVAEAQDRVGRQITLILTPDFGVLPDDPPETAPDRVFDRCRDLGATFCMPHQSVTDRILDRLHGEVRGMDRYAAMIREREMIPGLSTHAPETIPIADRSGVDVETYVQIYNAAGFLMQVEADWVLRIIRAAQKPVMTIKPLAAGKLLPAVGLAFVWNTIREQDMVVIGTMTSDEAREVIELSHAFLERRAADVELQTTRSKRVMVGEG